MTRMPAPTFLARLCAAALALAAAAWPAAADEAVPQFKDFAVAKIHKGKAAPPAIIDSETRTYRSALRKAAAGRVNFAGRYIVATWGCGAACAMGAIINAASGQVTMLPFTISGWRAVHDGFTPIAFRPDSRLMVFSGRRNEQGEMGRHYYVLERGKLKFLRTVESDGDFTAPPE